MLPINTIRYATDEFAFNKAGLTYTNTPLDCTAFTSVNGFTTAGTQPTNTDRRVAFKVGNTWYKVTGTGAVTLTSLPTQTVTAESLLSEGNTVTELDAATSVAGFIGKSVGVAIALVAPGDATTLPTLQLGIKGLNIQDQFTKVDYSPEYTLSNKEDVTVVNLTAITTTTNGGTVTVEASIKQAGTWSAYMPLVSAKGQKASAVKFKATYTVTVIGTSSATVNSVSILYRSNNAVVSGSTADVLTTTEDLGLSMRHARCMVKHQPLRDATLKAYVAFRDTSVERDMIQIGTGTGERQTITLADNGINHNTLRLFYGSQPLFDYDYNTELSQISCTVPVGSIIFASYSCGWQPETWVPMQKGSTQVS